MTANPGRRSIDQVSKDPAYKHEASQDMQVYPGWAQMMIFRHLESHELWAATCYMTDDDSTYVEPTSWYPVEAKTTVTYVKVK